MYLTDQEKETILLFTEGDHSVQLATYNEDIKTTLGLFHGCFPQACSLLYQTAEGRQTYSIAKEYLALCFFPLLLKDQRLQAALNHCFSSETIT